MPAVSCTCVKLAGAQNSCINGYIQRRHGVGHAAESTRLSLTEVPLMNTNTLTHCDSRTATMQQP